jgi:hypothetical protein
MIAYQSLYLTFLCLILLKWLVCCDAEIGYKFDAYSVAVLSDYDTDSIKKSLHLLIESSQLRIQLTNNCKKATKYLNWDSENEKLIPIFKGL